MDTYAVFDMKIKRTPEEILSAYIAKHGQPPQPLEVLVNKVDTESIPLPDDLKVVVKVERFVLPKHLFLGVEL